MVLCHTWVPRQSIESTFHISITFLYKIEINQSILAIPLGYYGLGCHLHIPWLFALSSHSYDNSNSNKQQIHRSGGNSYTAPSIHSEHPRSNRKVVSPRTGGPWNGWIIQKILSTVFNNSGLLGQVVSQNRWSFKKQLGNTGCSCNTQTRLVSLKWKS